MASGRIGHGRPVMERYYMILKILRIENNRVETVAILTCSHGV